MTQQPSYTLAKIASLIGAKLQGDPDCIITGVAGLSDAVSGQLSFLDNPRYRKYLATTKATAVILTPADLADHAINGLVMENPYLGYARAATLFEQKSNLPAGIHQSVLMGERCQIDPTVSMGPWCAIGSNVVIEKGVIIGAYCVIGDNVHIGANSHLFPRVTLYSNITMGQRVIIHSGAVIGSDGFGYANDRGVWHKIPQLGGVQIGNDVEIGANTTIDRGALNNTVIEDDVKLDNQIQIGHNVRIGAHTAVAGCSGIAGSTTIGKHCLIAGGVGIAGHLEICDRVVITAMSGVPHHIKEPGVYSGNPTQPNAEWRKSMVRVRQLDEMAHKITHLEKLIGTKL